MAEGEQILFMTRLALPSSLLVALLSSVATAQEQDQASGAEPPLAHALSAGLGTSNLTTASGLLGYRLLLSPTLQLGLELEGGKERRGYIAGYPVDGGGAFSGLAFVQGTVLRQGPLWLDLRAGAGARHHAGANPDPDNRAASGLALDASTAVLGDFAVIANVEAGRWLTVRAGLSAPLAVQVAPEVGLDVTGFLSHGGLAVHLTDQLSATLDGDIGGVFGFNGDGGKVRASGQLGLRWLLGANTADWRAF